VTSPIVCSAKQLASAAIKANPYGRPPAGHDSRLSRVMIVLNVRAVLKSRGAQHHLYTRHHQDGRSSVSGTAQRYRLIDGRRWNRARSRRTSRMTDQPDAGVGTIAQRLPSQISASGVVAVDSYVLPTAVQASAEEHETASKLLPKALVGLGVGMVFQVVPFHISASVASEEPPTATQRSGDVHETPPLNLAPSLVAGVGVIRQFAPRVQDSASDVSVPDAPALVV